jgi:protein phosphatase
MIYASKSSIGRRARNEDLFRVPKQEESVPFVAVADGMGGHAGGSVASRLVITGMNEELRSIRGDDPVGVLLRAVSAVNMDVYRTGQDSADLAGMGSTLVCALLFPTRFIAANVGDSRLYHFDGEKLEQVTVDHSLVEVLVQSGHITPEEARVHPNRNIITRAMGLSARVEADVFDRAWNPGDILLLCSDGLSGSVPHEEMQSVLVSDAPLQELCDTLVASALEHGATDNITVVLVQNEEGACA